MSIALDFCAREGKTVLSSTRWQPVVWDAAPDKRIGRTAQLVDGPIAMNLDTPQLLALAAALGWASGVRLYAVVFLTGLAGWLGWVALPRACTCCEQPVVLARAASCCSSNSSPTRSPASTRSGTWSTR